MADYDLPPQLLIDAELEGGYIYPHNATLLTAFLKGAGTKDGCPYTKGHQTSKNCAQAWNLGRDWRTRHGLQDSTYTEHGASG